MSKAGNNAKQAGELGEQTVLRVFGLSEPDVEVKTVMKQKPALIEVNQLERFTGKTYVFAIYNRGARKRRGKKRFFERGIKEALSEPMRFLFMTSEELVGLAKVGEFKLRHVKHEYQSGGRFYFEFQVSKHVAGMPFTSHEGHQVFNGDEHVQLAPARIQAKALIEERRKQEVDTVPF